MSIDVGAIELTVLVNQTRIRAIKEYVLENHVTPELTEHLHAEVKVLDRTNKILKELTNNE